VDDVTAILVAECIAKSFGERRVLTSATLRAVSGELRVMFGRNGIGKSTLLKIAAGWLSADSGSIHFAARAYLTVSLPQLAAQGLFFLPDHDLLSTAFTVRRQLEMMRSQFAGADLVEAAEEVGIRQHLDKRPSALSGGERRRAELAAVLVRRPRCLLADEPYRGIAPKDAEFLTSIFRSMAKSGMAVVVTRHEVSTLFDAADHVSWCTSGTSYDLGPPALAAQHREFQRDYLGPWLRGRAMSPDRQVLRP